MRKVRVLLLLRWRPIYLGHQPAPVMCSYLFEGSTWFTNERVHTLFLAFVSREKNFAWLYTRTVVSSRLTNQPWEDFWRYPSLGRVGSDSSCVADQGGSQFILLQSNGLISFTYSFTGSLWAGNAASSRAPGGRGVWFDHCQRGC